jgi:5-oxoprolinase (ATP-hydrolysing)
MSVNSIDTKKQWEFWVDRGGTFTDIVALSPDGVITPHKLLSHNPEQYDDAVLQGIKDILHVASRDAIPSQLIKSVKMGTTVATNALLERQGERTLLATTKGFKDALRIGYQNRPDLFAMQIDLPEQLYDDVIEISERIGADGSIVLPLELTDAEHQLRKAFEQGYRSLAILLMHGYRYHDHEVKLAMLAERIGFKQISVSHEVSALMKFVGRGDTTVVDAYLTPILRRYVDRISEELLANKSNVRLFFMQSNGGLTEADLFQGRNAILSGPAGGVVGAVKSADMIGRQKIIGFDMGGTSTDVFHFDGVYERAFDTQVAGVRMRAPMMRIHTVAAGGGSILYFDGGRQRVGPNSAGADPGPASYRRGGPLTVTDANLCVGRIDPDFFPNVFGAEGNEPLDKGIVSEKFTALAADISLGKTPEAIADGFLKIAVENMAQAIKKISVQRGYDITKYALACFGGAGAQLACRVADSLGMDEIIIHPLASVLSAYGMGLADIVSQKEKSVETPLSESTAAEINNILASLTDATRAEVIGQGAALSHVRAEHRLLVRYAGTDTAIEVAAGDPSDVKLSFEAAHQAQFGFVTPERSVIVEAAIAEAIADFSGVESRPSQIHSATDPECLDEKTGRLFVQGKWIETEIFSQQALLKLGSIDGPALIVSPHNTIVLDPGWRCVVLDGGQLQLSRSFPRARMQAVGAKADPVMLEIFNNRFMSIAEQMGFTLERTARSVNIKERLDFSCAVFDKQGALVANAPHMPVHLGSMGDSVKSVIRRQAGVIEPGDAFVLNAPYNGGTHLPDITVVTPVFDATSGELLFFTASRGHHADVGGVTPGSMPSDSKTVEDEGVLIDGFQLVEKGAFREKEIRAVLEAGAMPARNPDQNISDLKAQVAACEKGAIELRALVDEFGLDVIDAYMQHVQDNAEESVRRVIDRLNDGSFSVALDNGAIVSVNITVDRAMREATIDFTGSSPQMPNNFNAPRPVTRAAVLYVFRCLVNDDIPLNDGCLKPLNIVVPEGSLLNPKYPAAVVAGNVETSQAITDCLFGACGAMAAAQGTMNNLTFGNAEYQYYETICGGAGAGPTFDGASAVHTHMTNSRLTDPEILEWRFPVRVESFEIRTGSGGAGAHKGGDGAVRVLKFLEKMEVSILSGRRMTRPFGLAGGGAGQPGENIIVRSSGKIQPLKACDRAVVNPGDAISIKTPGGGGFGVPEN